MAGPVGDYLNSERGIRKTVRDLITASSRDGSKGVRFLQRFSVGVDALMKDARSKEVREMIHDTALMTGHYCTERQLEEMRQNARRMDRGRGR